MATTDKSVLEQKVLPELQEIASSLGVQGYQRLKKADLIDAIIDRANGEARESKAEVSQAETPAEARAEEPKAEPARAEAPARTDGPPHDRDRGRDRGPREGRPGEGRRGRRDRGRGRGRDRERDREATEEELAEAPVQTGILDVLPEGYGFLRTTGYLPSQQDIYVSLSQIRRFGLRKGDEVKGAVRRPKDNEKYFALLRIDTVNGVTPDEARQRREFEKLTPLFPEERFRLEHDATAVTERVIDLVAPIGKGQRGMVVSPPKAGKTTVLKQIANGIIQADPKTHVMVLLVDERPEEVTDWQRTVEAAEVVYSTFDKPAEQHTQVTELVLERAKRLVEQ
ncbi:MAG TPA: transcription termination factor Rho, partial [Actinomycetota bacterium]|nr:transcription termination factor Rho [Actinomycetota bacterium]